MNISFCASSVYRLSMAICMLFVVAAAPPLWAAPGDPVDSSAIEVPATRDHQPAKSESARNVSGAYVVVWETLKRPHYPYIGAIWARAYTAQGQPRGPQFHVVVADGKELRRISQSVVDVGIDADGNIVVVWIERHIQGDGWLLKGRRFDAAGNALGTDFTVADAPGFIPTQGLLQRLVKSDPSLIALHGANVAMAPDGRFAVAWKRVLTDHYIGSTRGHVQIAIRRYNADGSPLDAEPHVFAQTELKSHSSRLGGFRLLPGLYIPKLFARERSKTMNGLSLAMDANGDFVVAWSISRASDASGTLVRDSGLVDGLLNRARVRIYAKRFTNNDTLQSYPTQLITELRSQGGVSSVAMTADGTYAVAWRAYVRSTDDYSIFFRRMGGGSGAAVEVATGIAPEFEHGALRPPSSEIGLADDGILMVGWDRYVRIFGPQDQSLAPAFKVNEQQDGDTKITSVNPEGDPGFLVTWDQQFITTHHEDGSTFETSEYTVFTRRFASQ